MAARVGFLTVHLCITDGMTLKDKRQVVRSVLNRTRERFNVAAAEVGCLDTPRRAELAFTAVSNDGRHVREALDAVLKAVNGEPRAVVEFADIEVF